MAIKFSNWVVKPVWVLFKDLKSEMRNRYAMNTIVMFALTTLAVVSFSVGSFSLNSQITSSLFWLVIFFSSMSGLGQVFIKEEESKTVNLLKLIASPGTVLVGKLLFNLVLLLVLEAIIVPLFIIWMNLSILNPLLFVSVLFLGTLGLVCATTIIAAIISKSHVKGALLAVLSFPILLPLLIAGIDGTRLSLEGNDFSVGFGDLGLLGSYVVVMLTASILLFDFVWNE